MYRSRRRRWRLAPGLQHLVATTEKKGKGEKGEQSNREYSSKVFASKDLHYICMGICVKGQYRWTELQNARIKRGIASPVEDYASGSLHLVACRRE